MVTTTLTHTNESIFSSVGGQRSFAHSSKKIIKKHGGSKKNSVETLELGMLNLNRDISALSTEFLLITLTTWPLESHASRLSEQSLFMLVHDLSTPSSGTGVGGGVGGMKGGDS